MITGRENPEMPTGLTAGIGWAKCARQNWDQQLQLNPEFTAVGASSRIAYDGDPHDQNKM
jgi:hypothetical protein